MRKKMIGTVYESKKGTMKRFEKNKLVVARELPLATKNAD